ncbi:hypothetical protein SAMN05216215_106833 [Saccharopolyspora shandongensis]|uniref:Uncharacterized protein n=1 Tax=Saccharopolyspora shandongensis TaxID=418495 RepID=A0A1H3SPI2_9PSEU|nr:hypothetical protein SAMN05216215_106833 [Saccharopolyspora shandongensis]
MAAELPNTAALTGGTSGIGEPPRPRLPDSVPTS